VVSLCDSVIRVVGFCSTMVSQACHAAGKYFIASVARRHWCKSGMTIMELQRMMVGILLGPGIYVGVV